MSIGLTVIALAIGATVAMYNGDTQKAESVINLDVEKDGTVKVTNPYSRGYQFDEFSFDVNKDALPYLIDSF